MTFSKDTVIKVVKKLKESMAKFMEMPFEKLKIHISKGNSKIGHTHNFSLAPIVTCSNCQKCKYSCYDVKACNQYKNVVTARAENTVMVLKNMSGTFDQIDEYMAKRKRNFFFRFHVSGEIINSDYFTHVVKIGMKYYNWRVLIYTKNYEIINNWIDENGKYPENLTVMFSKWYGLPCNNPHNLPTFTCFPEGAEPLKGAWHCPGNCDICKNAKRGCFYGESAWTYEH